MIRLVHVISDLEIGGAEMMLAKLMGRMDRGSFSNVVVSLTDRGKLSDFIESIGVRVFALGMKRGRPSLLALVRLIHILKTTRPSIVQSWLYHADFLCSLAVKAAASPVLVWNVRCSNMNMECYSPLTTSVRRMLAWWSSTPSSVVVNSEAGKKLHERLGYRPRRWDVIPNGFDTERFRPDSAARQWIRDELRLSPDAIIVALIARVDPMKDHATFLESARQVMKFRRDIHFLLVGKDTETLAAPVAQLGLTERVHLKGLREDVDRILPGVDLLCLSSAFGEGFPNVIGEAMACGVPCIATDVGDIKEIIGSTGNVVPIRDPTALTTAVLDVLSRSTSERLELGQRARARVQSLYSLPSVVNRYESLYKELSTSVSV